MSKRLAGSFFVRQNQYRSCCYFTHFMPTFRQYCAGGKLVCGIIFLLWGKLGLRTEKITRTAHHSLKAPARTAVDVFKT